MIQDVFAAELSSQNRIGLYRSEVAPDLFPNERPMLVDNWSQEEREAFCGQYEETRNAV